MFERLVVFVLGIIVIIAMVLGLIYALNTGGKAPVSPVVVEKYIQLPRE